MTIAAAVRSLLITRSLAVVEPLSSHRVIAAVFGLSVAAPRFQEAYARRKRPLIAPAFLAPGASGLHPDLASV